MARQYVPPIYQKRSHRRERCPGCEIIVETAIEVIGKKEIRELIPDHQRMRAGQVEACPGSGRELGKFA